MKLLKSPNAWSCLLTSAAMVLDKPIDTLLAALPHDGSAHNWSTPGQGPIGFHIQEIIDLFDLYEYALTPVEMHPSSLHPSGAVRCVWGYEESKERFASHLIDVIGIITGSVVSKGRTTGHAVAWDKVVFDPIGRTYPFDKCGEHGFDPQIFWKLV